MKEGRKKKRILELAKGKVFFFCLKVRINLRSKLKRRKWTIKKRKRRRGKIGSKCGK